jgi:hypothetical protein
MWPSLGAKRMRDAPDPVVEKPLPLKRARLVEPHSALPGPAAELVNAFLAQPPVFAAFEKKYGARFPATYLGEVFLSGWHPRVPHDNRARFVWRVDSADYRYLAGAEVLITTRNGVPMYPREVKVVRTTGLCLDNNGAETQSAAAEQPMFLSNATIAQVRLFVDVKRCLLGGCRRGCETCERRAAQLEARRLFLGY